MSTKPKFSIVMPVWNRGDIVQNAIRSVLDQSVKDYEFIIVDDGSTDGTERIIKSFENPRIKYFKIPHTGHIGQVRNYGNRKAKGEWIVVQDSDDRSFPDRLYWIDKYTDKDTDIIYHDMYVASFDPEHNAAMRRLRKIGRYSKDKLMKEQYIPGQIAYRRKSILKVPYDDRIQCCDDFQVLLELALNDMRFKYIDKPLYEYFMRSDSVNILGEIDGRRFEDTRIIVDILKKKYKIKAIGELKKWSPMTGKMTKQEYVE